MTSHISTSVVDQIILACKPRNRLATAIGFLLGGFVPLASYVVAHYEIARGVPLYTQLPVYFVAGGLAYSARTVLSWGRMAFSHGLKAAGFCLLLEGVAVTSAITWLGIVALVYLVCINGTATACNLVSQRKQSNMRKGNR